MGVFAIGIEHAFDVAVEGGLSAVSNGVSENPRGYSDPNPEGEPLQKDSRKNGNGSRQVASPAKAVPCGNECRKSKTKRCHEDDEKQVACENRHRVRQLPQSLGYFHIFGCCCLRSAATPDLFWPDRRIAAGLPGGGMTGILPVSGVGARISGSTPVGRQSTPSDLATERLHSRVGGRGALWGDGALLRQPATRRISRGRWPGRLSRWRRLGKP
jgi:hypothetical protein